MQKKKLFVVEIKKSRRVAPRDLVAAGSAAKNLPAARRPAGKLRLP